MRGEKTALIGRSLKGHSSGCVLMSGLVLMYGLGLYMCTGFLENLMQPAAFKGFGRISRL